MAERWREIAGPVGRLATGPRNAITDVPGVRVGQAQAASGEPTGVTVVAPPSVPVPAGTAVLNGMGELTGKIEIDERGTLQTPVYLCGSLAVGIVHHAAMLAAGGGPERHRAAGGRRVRRQLAGRLAHGGERGRRAGARGARRGGRGGNGRRRHRDDVLRVPRRHRHRLAGGRRAPRRGAAALQFRRPRAARPARHEPRADRAPEPHGGVLHRRLRDRCAARRRTSCGAWRCGRCSGSPGPAPTAGRGRGRSASPSRPAPPPGCRTTELNPYFAAAWEASQEAVYNCLVAGQPGELREGGMQDAFPVEEVRRLARGPR